MIKYTSLFILPCALFWVLIAFLTYGRPENTDDYYGVVYRTSLALSLITLLLWYVPAVWSKRGDMKEYTAFAIMLLTAPSAVLMMYLHGAPFSTAEAVVIGFTSCFALVIFVIFFMKSGVVRQCMKWRNS